MESWKRKRLQFRREFTNLADKTEKAVDSNDGTARHMFQLLSEAATNLFEAETAVRDLWCEAENFNEAEFQEDQDKSMTYRIRWHKIRSLFVKKTHSRIRTSFSLHSTKSSRKPRGNRNKQRLPSLPRLELVKFDGNVKSWLLFWGQFKKIHEDPYIDSTDKYQYLLQSMAPNSSARHLVESYPPCGDNYRKAIEALKARFARDDVLIETYMRGLLSLMQHKKVPNNLSNLYDNLQRNLQALETLGVTNDKYASMLFPVIESVLPESVLRAWHRSRPDSRDLTSIMHFLRQEVESDERIRLAKYDEKTLAERRSPTAYFVAEKRGNKEGLKQLSSFIWCGRNSIDDSAVQYYRAAKAKLKDREEYMKNKMKACSICLKRHHIAKKCKSFPKCLTCKKRHFTLMCADKAADYHVSHKLKETLRSFELLPRPLTLIDGGSGGPSNCKGDSSSCPLCFRLDRWR